VRTLRGENYDVLSIAEQFPSFSDNEVLQLAIKENRILITEDKDFGEWIFAHGKKVGGVILIRFPGNARSILGDEINLLITSHGQEIKSTFVVLEPGRARLRKI
jgi:predicted nuclease of predicted toxin-antitoxin system